MGSLFSLLWTSFTPPICRVDWQNGGRAESRGSPFLRDICHAGQRAIRFLFMGWVSTRQKELKDWVHKNQTIFDDSVTVYEALWNQIVTDITEAKAEGFPVDTNGGGYSRKIRLQRPPLASPNEER